MRYTGFQKAWLTFLLIILLAPVQALSQSSDRKKERPPEAVQAETLKIDTSLVLVDAAVVSKRTSGIVGDLKREDFNILEDGKPQQITHFSKEELPLSVVLLLDVSSSVFPVIEKIRDSAQDALARLKPTDHVAVMLFASRARLTAPLTTDRRTVKNALEDFWENVGDVGSEGTVIGEGIYAAARYLRQKTELTERRAIILITDDEDYGYGHPPQGLVLRELHAGNITLSAIVVNPRRKSRAGIAMSVSAAAMLAAINPISGAIMLGSALLLGHNKKPPSTSSFFSDNTGGVTVNTKKEDVERMFVEMMTMLRTRYTFGYPMPEQPDQEDDRRFREIKLNVTDSVQKQKGDMVVLARRGYFSARKSQPEPATPAQVKRPMETATPGEVEIAEADFGLPELHIIRKMTLGPSYSCRPAEEFKKGYQATALFLSEFSRKRNSPDLLFNGACKSEDFFDASTAGDDMSLIADLGDVSIEDVTAQKAFNFQQVHSFADYSRFARTVKVEFNHTYAVLLNETDKRGLFVFRVVGYLPNERVDLLYAVKHYQILNLRKGADGFHWTQKNDLPPDGDQ